MKDVWAVVAGFEKFHCCHYFPPNGPLIYYTGNSNSVLETNEGYNVSDMRLRSFALPIFVGFICIGDCCRTSQFHQRTRIIPQKQVSNEIILARGWNFVTFFEFSESASLESKKYIFSCGSDRKNKFTNDFFQMQKRVKTV